MLMVDGKINLLSILPSLLYTGAEQQVVNLLNSLSADVFCSHLLSLGDELDLLENLDRDKVMFHHSPRKGRYDFSPRKEIAKIIDTHEIAILHCTNQIPILYGFLGKRKARRKVKFLGALHTTINRNLKNEMFDWFVYAPLMTFCDGIITVCDNQKKHWSRKYPYLKKKFRTIHNGIDMEKYRDSYSDEEKATLKQRLSIAEDEVVLGIMAEFRPEKGHEYAIRALKVLADTGNRAKLMFIGSGERETELRTLTAELRVEERIIWLGYQKDPRPYLSVCDVLVVPSFAETFSLTILEGLAIGKPVVATDVGGTSEMVIEGKNGFLVPPKDSDSLAAKLRSLSEDRSLRNRLAGEARESVVRSFSIAAMVDKTESLFKDSLGRNENHVSA